MRKLVTVTDDSLISELGNRDDLALVYPLKSFCVGYETMFDAKDIKGFCLVNRILNDEALDELEDILKNNDFEGIIFDDLGVIELVKNRKLTKILLLDHLATNSRSINYYLDYVDSVIVSNDLTKDEIKCILSKAKKPLVVNVFGLKTLMYSRRLLVSNYHKHHNLDNDSRIDASIEGKAFKIVESKHGCKFYAYPYYEALELLECDNVMFFWYDAIGLEKNKILNVVNNNDLTGIPTDKLFLNKKTVYKVSDING